MKPKKYVYTKGCHLCTNGYNSVPCVICGGLGGRCCNPACFNGEVAVSCSCNPLPYYVENTEWTVDEATEKLGWLEKEGE